MLQGARWQEALLERYLVEDSQPEVPLKLETISFQPMQTLPSVLHVLGTALHTI